MHFRQPIGPPPGSGAELPARRRPRPRGPQEPPREAARYAVRAYRQAAAAPASAITDSTDPRWVLAVRTAECLQGAILPPEQRERLIHTGKLLGLSAFDATLIIAIIQDRARRGLPPHTCPSAAADQLAVVSPQQERPAGSVISGTALVITVSAVLLLEAAIVCCWLAR